MRIYRNRFYVRAQVPGISGFKRWNERAYSVVTGLKAARERTEIVGELLPIAEDHWRLSGGKMPEYQDVVITRDALKWLEANPYAEIVRLDPETRSKDIAPNYAEA